MSCGFGIWFDFSLLYNIYAYKVILKFLIFVKKQSQELTRVNRLKNKFFFSKLKKYFFFNIIFPRATLGPSAMYSIRI